MINNVPIFPLSHPLFEEGVLPLQIFEPRYLDLVRECTREAKAFGVCMIVKGKETGQVAEHAEVGTLALIRDFDQTETGLLYIRALGERRFRICKRWVQANALIRADIEILGEFDDLSAQPNDEQFAKLSQLLEQLHQQLKQQHPDAFHKVIETPLRYQDRHWVTNRLIELIQVPPSQKQHWLEETRSRRFVSLFHYLDQQGVF
jgi:Lon protease-like protein